MGYGICKNMYIFKNKNRRKAIFNWAAKGLLFLRSRGGGGGRGAAAIQTQATTKPCRRPLHATESHVRLKQKLIQNIVPV